MPRFTTNDLARVREDFYLRGETVAGWARRHGFSANIVYHVLRGSCQALHGDGHRVAVALGLKASLLGNTEIPQQQESTM
ncbi:DNA-binding protein [Roseateles amylovorans]|uniref:DNA-binding protein n=1 Tax=Roseateles amylovorans TaxID=2978473 RepID=A0ABY6B311_9BURK|nr:DNA-binding protein [Roseateles amylovorans]UXH77913.1 DNA-binding protein [Roseateles amylovorans]